MRQDKGQPSGTNKSDMGTGVPTDKYIGNMERNDELTDQYTDDNKDIADSVRTNNPNRNVDKTDATTAGGYKQ